MFYIFLTGSLALLFISLFLIVRTQICRTEITGTYIGYRSYGGKLIHDYVPVFQYEYEGVSYEQPVLQTFSKEYVVNNFDRDHTYPILLSPKYPKNIVLSRKVQMTEILSLIVGLILTGAMLFGK